MDNHVKKIKLGIAGLGTVGQGVYDILRQNQAQVIQQHQLQFTFSSILVRDYQKAQQNFAEIANKITHKIDDFWQQSFDLFIEVIGGTTLALELVRTALTKKIPVITANKALIATYGQELLALSKQQQTPLYFEAAVAGGVPIVDVCRQSFSTNNIQQIAAIMNGTSNFILSAMQSNGMSFETALTEAQNKGYAEANPTLDINGTDSAQKSLILAYLCYGKFYDSENIAISGIEDVAAIDIQFTKKIGYCIKLLSVVKKHSDSIEIRTQAALIAEKTMLGNVQAVNNAIALTGDAIGHSFLFGEGAGKMATGSAVIADIIRGANFLQHRHFSQQSSPKQSLPLLDILATETPYYVRISVNDTPGVIAAISQLFSDHQIGISGTHSMIDPLQPDKDFVEIVLLLHTCSLGKIKQAIQQISQLSFVQKTPVYYRIETSF